AGALGEAANQLLGDPLELAVAVAVRRRPLHPQCPGQLPFVGGPVDGVAGLIACDKFCWTRYGRLRLAWWRRPLRLRSDRLVAPLSVGRHATGGGPVGPPSG